MIVLNHARMFGFGHFGVVQSSTIGCALVTAPEGLFKGYSTAFQAFEGKWAGVSHTKTGIVAKAFLHPKLSKKQVAEVHEALLKRLDRRLDELKGSDLHIETEIDGEITEAEGEVRKGRWSEERWNLEVAIEGAIAEAKEEGLVVDSVTEAALKTAQAVRSILKEPPRPQGIGKMALSGAEIRNSLISLIEKFEAENNQLAIAFAGEEGAMLIHPKFIDLIRAQTSEDGVPGDLLEPALGLVFPTADATRRMNKEWASMVASYRGKPNTASLLREKADALAGFIASNDIAVPLYCRVARSMEPEMPGLTDEQKVAARLEELICWYRVVDELAYRALGRQRDIFVDFLIDSFAQVAALQGGSPNAIASLWPQRSSEYEKFRKWVAEGGEGSSGTLLWEAAKHVGEQIGMDRNIIFVVQFEIEFLKLLQQALIRELLMEREVTAK